MIQNRSSNPIIMRYGVPQESILLLLLFLIYINDLVDCWLMEKVLLYSYADGVPVFYVGEEKETLDIVRSDIDKIKIIKNK